MGEEFGGGRVAITCPILVGERRRPIFFKETDIIQQNRKSTVFPGSMVGYDLLSTQVLNRQAWSCDCPSFANRSIASLLGARVGKPTLPYPALLIEQYRNYPTDT